MGLRRWISSASDSAVNSSRSRLRGGGRRLRLVARQRDDHFVRSPEAKALSREFLDRLWIAAETFDGLAELKVFLPKGFYFGCEDIDLAVLLAPFQISVVAGNPQQHERNDCDHRPGGHPNALQLLCRLGDPQLATPLEKRFSR
jgi:hypothetical protein